MFFGHDRVFIQGLYMLSYIDGIIYSLELHKVKVLLLKYYRIMFSIYKS